MPNWCSNFLRLAFENKDCGKEILDGLEAAFEKGELLSATNPVPFDLATDSSPTRCSEQEREMKIATYGTADWYDFSVSEWGVKWDCGGSNASVVGRTKTILELTFDSPWGPPLAWYEHLSSLFPDMRIYANFIGEDSSFVGRWSDEHGKEFYDVDEAPEDLLEEVDYEPYEDELDEEVDDEEKTGGNAPDMHGNEEVGI